MEEKVQQIHLRKRTTHIATDGNHHGELNLAFTTNLQRKNNFRTPKKATKKKTN